MKQVGFAIVGCGMVADFHAAAITEIPNAKLTAVSSRSIRNAKRVADKYGCPYYTDFRELLKRDDVDIVNICTASGAHMEPAVAAAENGKHVLIEKPLEITLERCDTIIHSCEGAGVKLCGIFQSRFTDSSTLVERAIEEGRFGTLTLGDAYVKWWRPQSYYDEGGWKGTKALDGGGALMNQSIHAVDLLQWFMGAVRNVSAVVKTLAHTKIDVEDTGVAALEFENGALGTIEGATSAYPGFLKRLEISGDKGSVVLREEDIITWQFADEKEEDRRIRQEFQSRTKTGGGASDPRAISHEGHRKQFVDFIESLEEEREPLVSGKEARKAVEIVLAIYKSSELGRKVDLPL